MFILPNKKIRLLIFLIRDNCSLLKNKQFTTMYLNILLEQSKSQFVGHMVAYENSIKIDRKSPLLHQTSLAQQVWNSTFIPDLINDPSEGLKSFFSRAVSLG